MDGGAVRYYYCIHPESGSAFTCTDPPELFNDDPCVIEVDYDEYHRACIEWGLTPVHRDHDLVDLLG